MKTLIHPPSGCRRNIDGISLSCLELRKLDPDYSILNVIVLRTSYPVVITRYFANLHACYLANFFAARYYFIFMEKIGVLLMRPHVLFSLSPRDNPCTISYVPHLEGPHHTRCDSSWLDREMGCSYIAQFKR